MPVDKFGRNGDRATPVYSGINIVNITNSFLRRDWVIPLLELLIGIAILLKMWRIRLSNQDVGTKNYVDKNAITTDGGVVYGDIKLVLVLT